MEIGKCKHCQCSILYLETKGHIQFGGMPPPVQLDDSCPKCWVNNHPGEPHPKLPGWEYVLKKRRRKLN